jgi:hypothetical protein
MPGPYAHITLLYELMRPTRLNSIFVSSEFLTSLTKYFPYCALGAVSPDYPNLAGKNCTASHWADAMHLTRASEMITTGIRRVRSSKAAAREKQIAWLLGYCAHLATDVTIHPVVQAKVGKYAENQRQHRICEMNQDSYIYRRMNLGEIGESDLFAVTVAQCSNSENISQLDSDIVTLWEGMLDDVHPELYLSQAPDITSWHRGFVDVIAEYSKRKIRLFPLANVIATKMDLAYPAYDLIDNQFVEDQLVPSQEPLCLHYDEIFDHAAGNVTVLWRQVEQAICADDSSAPPSFDDWNLDNGCNEHGALVFW